MGIKAFSSYGQTRHAVSTQPADMIHLTQVVFFLRGISILNCDTYRDYANPHRKTLPKHGAYVVTTNRGWSGEWALLRRICLDKGSCEKIGCAITWNPYLVCLASSYKPRNFPIGQWKCFQCSSRDNSRKPWKILRDYLCGRTLGVEGDGGYAYLKRG